jgi:two-component system, NtrC family, nitrogen regulation sensor histidine kinase NtrY
MVYDEAGQGRPPRLRYERRILLLALAGGLPALVLLQLLLWSQDFSAKVQWTSAVLIGGAWLATGLAVRERVVRPLQILSNLLAALREGDYSIRARGAGFDDALGLAFAEVNALSEPLREQHLGALEATAFLRKVMAEIDVAVFALDEERKLRLVNRAGERLLAQPAERLLGRSADGLGLERCLTGEPRRVIEAVFPAASVGRWELRRSTFRQGGMPHQLIVLTDLSKTLREEERQVWQRLVRVLSHEINNSLAPIKSIAGSLQGILKRVPAPADRDADLERGLKVISGRAEALNRFMAAYARLARLPRPQLGPLDVREWVHRVVELEKRLPVRVIDGPELVIQADGDQLDQALINLVGNAVDASLETGGGVSVSWARLDGQVEVHVVDDGPGLTDTENVFVPFFTTKLHGTGIGLALSRQIAEAHNGSLMLENRVDHRGCQATLRIPM